MHKFKNMEIGDPKEYIRPDVDTDFTTIQLKEVNPSRTRVSGILGKPSADFYKVSVSHSDGYICIGQLTPV